MLTKKDLLAIEDVIDRKLEDKLETKLEEKLETKLEKKLKPIKSSIKKIQTDQKAIISLFDKLPRTESPRYSTLSLHERAVLESMYSLSHSSEDFCPRCSASEYKEYIDLEKIVTKVEGHLKVPPTN